MVERRDFGDEVVVVDVLQLTMRPSLVMSIVVIYENNFDRLRVE